MFSYKKFIPREGAYYNHLFPQILPISSFLGLNRSTIAPENPVLTNYSTYLQYAGLCPPLVSRHPYGSPF